MFSIASIDIIIVCNDYQILKKCQQQMASCEAVYILILLFNKIFGQETKTAFCVHAFKNIQVQMWTHSFPHTTCVQDER